MHDRPTSGTKARRPAALAALLAAGAFVAPPAGAAGIPETVTVTASALSGAGLDPDKVPGAVQVLDSGDLARFGTADLLRGLDRSAGGVSLDEAQGNRFQPNLVYRGFEASPLQGNAQGLAVYLDGMRFNQPFGDTVNWDLVPAIAIERLTLEGANPVFGLNALGGSLSLTMKNGFDQEGGEAALSGGSYGQAEATIQYGANDGRHALYAAATAARDDGWRAHSPSRLGQLFADLGWRDGRTELHLALTAADTDLTGNGSSPVELLAVNRRAVFTYPDNTKNRFALANLHGTLQVNAMLSLAANLYASSLHQTTRNGDASDAGACASPAGLLCLDGTDILTDTSGTPIADLLSGGTYAQLNRTATQTTGFGGALQAVHEATLFGWKNRLLGGVAYDAGRSNFAASSELGALGADRGFVGPGIVIAQADGSIAPVRVAGDNDYLGLYASDILDLGDALTLTFSARYNDAHVRLRDRLGTALDGEHRYAHLNPALGASYRISGAVTLYAGVSEANRAPTPAELSCADETAPCSLTNFFVSDPPLKQVVAHTVEAGLRGKSAILGGRLGWQAGLYRTDSDDDILLAASPVIGRAFFRNVGETRRQGADAALDFEAGSWRAELSYSYTDATFQTALTLNSPDNPHADADGRIEVRPGDRIPGIAPHLFKASLVWQATDALRLSGAARVAAGQMLRGDESNLNPDTGGYAVFDLGAEYRLSGRLAVFAAVSNLLDAHYASFGTFAPTADVPIAEAPGAGNPRSLSPGAPQILSGGLRLTL